VTLVMVAGKLLHVLASFQHVALSLPALLVSPTLVIGACLEELELVRVLFMIHVMLLVVVSMSIRLKMLLNNALQPNPPLAPSSTIKLYVKPLPTTVAGAPPLLQASV